MGIDCGGCGEVDARRRRALPHPRERGCPDGAQAAHQHHEISGVHFHTPNSTLDGNFSSPLFHFTSHPDSIENADLNRRTAGRHEVRVDLAVPERQPGGAAAVGDDAARGDTRRAGAAHLVPGEEAVAARGRRGAAGQGLSGRRLGGE